MRRKISNLKSQIPNKSQGPNGKIRNADKEPTVRSRLTDAHEYLSTARSEVQLAIAIGGPTAAKLRGVTVTIGLAMDKVRDALLEDVPETPAKSRRARR